MSVVFESMSRFVKHVDAEYIIPYTTCQIFSDTIRQTTHSIIRQNNRYVIRQIIRYTMPIITCYIECFLYLQFNILCCILFSLFYLVFSFIFSFSFTFKKLGKHLFYLQSYVFDNITSKETFDLLSFPENPLNIVALILVPLLVVAKSVLA